MKVGKGKDEGRAGGMRPGDRWRLQDAKARFSEVVRRARTTSPNASRSMARTRSW